MRDGKTVRSIYCGGGERGRQAEREDEERRRANGPITGDEIIERATQAGGWQLGGLRFLIERGLAPVAALEVGFSQEELDRRGFSKSLIFGAR